MPFAQLQTDAGYDSEANHHHYREGLAVDSLMLVKEHWSARVARTPVM